MQTPWQVAYLWVAWIFMSVLRIAYHTRPTKVQWLVCAACLPVLASNGAFLATGLCNPAASNQTIMVTSGLIAASVLVRTPATDKRRKVALRGALLATVTHVTCMLGIALAQPWGGCTMVLLGTVLLSAVVLGSVARYV